MVLARTRPIGGLLAVILSMVSAPLPQPLPELNDILWAQQKHQPINISAQAPRKKPSPEMYVLLEQLLQEEDSSVRKTKGFLLSEHLYREPQALGLLVSAGYDEAYSVESRRDLARVIARPMRNSEENASRYQLRIFSSMLIYHHLLGASVHKERLAQEMLGLACDLDVNSSTEQTHYGTIQRALDVAHKEYVPDPRQRGALSQMMAYSLAVYMCDLGKQGLDVTNQQEQFTFTIGVSPTKYLGGEGMDPFIFWLAVMQQGSNRGIDDLGLGSMLKDK